MGSGFKDFGAGDVLTAADVDNYLMRQTVMTFADASARDTALTGVLDEGMHAYLEDTNALTYYTGSAWKTVYNDWTSFTPAWSNLTVGNGSNVGRYRYVAGDLHVQVSLTFGSTTAISGAVSMTLPNSETASGGSIRNHGVSNYDDDSGGSEAGNVIVGSAGTSAQPSVSGSGAVNTSNPFTWTTSDRLEMDFRVAL